MEAKDFVLLMSMPILLIGLVTYTNNSITGLAVNEQKEESNAIGTYSVMPSFREKMDYDIKEYSKIKNQLSQIAAECKNTGDIEQCLTAKSSELKWGCNELNDEAYGILDDFVDKLNECMHLTEDGVVCMFSLDNRNILTMPNTFDITLTNENQRIMVEVKRGANAFKDYTRIGNLAYSDDYNTKDTSSKNTDRIRYIINFQGRTPVVDKAFAYSNGVPIQLSKFFLFYKAGGRLRFIEEGQEGNFRTGFPANKIIDVPRAKGFRFCAKSPSGSKAYAYDNADSALKLRDIVYKFAVTYPIPTTPPPIKILKAEDKLKAEKSIVVRWGKAKWEDGTDVNDIGHYNIYCSKASMKDKNTKEIKLESKPALAVKSNADYDEWVVEINKCGKDSIEDDTEYYFAVTAVSKSRKESKAVIQSSAKSVDDLAPGTQQIVLINSDGKKEKKLSSACIGLPKTSASGTPGNIWVGFFAPDKNEDGATSVSSEEQFTYHLFFSRQSPLTNNLDDCSDPKKCVKLSFVPKEDTSAIQELDERRFNKDREIGQQNQLFEEGSDYCFTVAAKDKKNNIIKNLPYNFEKPMQWIDLENKQVIKGVFNEQNEVIYP